MEIYLLKSAACLAIFLVFYKVFMESESFHQIKRFYLVSGLVASFIIPLVTFTTYVEVLPVTSTLSFIESGVEAPSEIEKTINYVPIILWSIYGLGVLFFSLKFFRNLFSLVRKIQKNPNIKKENVFHVLLKAPTTPHTFFSFIFLNREKFQKKEIPQEVLVHEEAHAVQKHSLDVIFIELLQVVFWFNPLLYFFKESIKLNHEFLADYAVLHQGNEPTAYQNILLAFSSNATPPAMANSIHYSSFKKRFTVMKIHTSKRAQWLKTGLLLPLVALVLYGFSTTQTIEKIASTPEIENEYEASTSDQERLTARSISIEILNESYVEVDGIKTLKKNLDNALGSLHTDISKENRDRIINIHVSSTEEIAYDDLVYIQKIATPYGYHRIVTPKEEIVRSKGNVPAAVENEIVPHKNYTKEFINNTSQDKATRAEIAEYNALAKKYNAIDIEKRIIKLKDLNRLEIIYKKMTPSQKAEAQPFPECFPPPPPPIAPLSPNGKNMHLPPPPPPPSKDLGTAVSKKYNNSIILYINNEDIYLNGTKTKLSNFTEALNTHTNNWAKEDYKLHGLAIELVEVSDEFIDKVNTAYRKSNLAKNSSSKDKYLVSKDSQFPPPPPPPPVALDHVIEMAKEGAEFFYEGKKISSDKAIDIVRKNKDINILTDIQKGVHVVKLTTKPIYLKN